MDASAAARERLRQWIEHLEHVLPAQAPIRDFVHHNTLHGFQHLPFAEALAAVHRLTGAEPYLPEQRFRALHTAGRIDDSDLASALEDIGCTDLDREVLPGITRRRILLAALLEPPEIPAAATLAWRQRESTVADQALWALCRQRWGAAPGVGQADDAVWEAEAVRVWRTLWQKVGQDWSLRTLLEHLTGEDVLEAVRTVLQRHLAAHLDLGVAAWRNPQRAKGFYAAWRASAGMDLAWELAELSGARDELAWLPEDAFAALLQELATLVPDEQAWFPYVERLALELPGWSGMFLWRDRHPERGDGTPVNMVDYLAVRVVLERLLTEDLLRRLTGAAMTLNDLHDHFAARPAEFYVRHGLRVLALPEELAHAAEALINPAAERPPVGDAPWRQLARRIARWQETESAAPTAWAHYALLRRLGLAAETVAAWTDLQVAELQREATAIAGLGRREVWLLAYETHYRQQIFSALAANHGRCRPQVRPRVQAVLCMDDREEGTRRHLEELAPDIETFGAAGFFGVPMLWQGLDDAQPVALCPVVVRPAHLVREEALAADAGRRHGERRGRRLQWREHLLQGTGRASLAAPMLAAVAAPGALAALAANILLPAWAGEVARRWRDRFEGRPATRPQVTAPAGSPPATADAPRAGLTDDEQAAWVLGFLRMIGLTDRFAPLVLMLGHGSGSNNNPHRAAYDCGACSGRHGGPNARVFAAMANRDAVRQRLAARGLSIPAGTWFVAAQHNTCDDSVEWYDTDLVPATRHGEFDRLVAQLAEACRAHAAERCRRLASAPATANPWQARRHMVGRRHDISQARPELGHATNAAALIGRRTMSRGLFLDRRAFLISYDPTQDADGTIVEGILLAAGPVGAGISLEYYFSTVDNARFGCGSKVTHNLAGMFGVMEGADSDLRTGLPLQMVEIHEAMRLLVVVEQTTAVLSAIVARQPALQELIGNGWISVAAQDPGSGALSRFCPRRGWLPWQGATVLPQVARSRDWFAGRREALPPALLLEGLP